MDGQIAPYWNTIGSGEGQGTTPGPRRCLPGSRLRPDAETSSSPVKEELHPCGTLVHRNDAQALRDFSQNHQDNQDPKRRQPLDNNALSTKQNIEQTQMSLFIDTNRIKKVTQQIVSVSLSIRSLTYPDTETSQAPLSIPFESLIHCEQYAHRHRLKSSSAQNMHNP